MYINCVIVINIHSPPLDKTLATPAFYFLEDKIAYILKHKKEQKICKHMLY